MTASQRLRNQPLAQFLASSSHKRMDASRLPLQLMHGLTFYSVVFGEFSDGKARCDPLR